MIPLFRYNLAVMLHSQRYLPPALLFVICTGIFAADAGTQPVIPTFAPMTGVACVCSAWLTGALINVADPVQRAITAVNVGRPRLLLIAEALVVLATSAVLAVLVLALPIVLGNNDFTALDLLVGTEALLTGSCLGIAIGMVTSRHVIRRPGYAAVVALSLLLIFVLVRSLPPVSPVILLLAQHPSATPDLLLAVTGHSVVALLALVACTALTQRIAARRD